jgi:hypothetical protein
VASMKVVWAAQQHLETAGRPGSSSSIRDGNSERLWHTSRHRSCQAAYGSLLPYQHHAALPQCSAVHMNIHEQQSSHKCIISSVLHTHQYDTPAVPCSVHCPEERHSKQLYHNKAPPTHTTTQTSTAASKQSFFTTHLQCFPVCIALW